MFHKRRDLVLPLLIGILLCVVLLWPAFSRGHIPISTSYMISWYEPWKTETTVNGIPTIPHKPVVDDAFRHLYPLRTLAAELMKKGEWPLWNPYNGAGTPLLAVMHPGYLTPFGLFFLLLSPHIAWTVYVALQPIVLGLATYWYTTKLKFSRNASVFTVVILMLSGFSIVRLEYGEFLYVLTGLPILLGIVEDTRHRLWIPIVVAIMILSGQPHMIVYTLSVFALYTLVRLPFPKTLIFAGLSILGVAMSAIQLVPGLELFSQSTISRQTSEFIFDKFLLPLSHLITIVIPNYFGNQATYNYFGPHDYVETIAYVGSIPVLFALFALLRMRKDVVVRFFAILALLATLTTLQWAGATLFYLLPIPVLSADVPSRIFVVATFALSILAGIGVTTWEKNPIKMQRWAWMFGVFLGVVLTATYLLYRFHAACPPVIPQCRMVSLRTTLIEVVLFAVFALSIRSKLVWIPIVLVLVSGLYNAQKFLPFSPKETLFPELPVITSLKEMTWFNRFAVVGTEIRSNLLSIYKLQGADYFDPLHVKRYAELVSYVNTGDRAKGLTRSDIKVISDATVSAEPAFRRERFWDMTGTNTLVAKENGKWQVSQRPTALPRAYLVTDVRVESDPQKQLAVLFAPTTDIRSVAFVEEQISSSGSGEAAIVSYEPNRVALNVSPDADSFLVLSDTYYPGWNAYIDGVKTPVYRTNYTFRGVVVPAGKHEVAFRYQPDSLQWGIRISILAFLIWGVILLRGADRNRTGA